MEVDVESGEDDGMVEVMRMFTSLTNALFTSLEHAAEGFEQLLLNILNLTGKYMDILVPRPGVYKCTETYYKAFNTWLLGRMFYISSVGNLSRIHPLSTEVQLRVIHTLCVKEASFYSQLHLQYCSILEQLLLYYQDNAQAHTPATLPLYYFTPDKINIPTDKLDLEPMYVRVTGLQQCCSIIELVLRLLGDSIPLHADDMHRSHYEKFFQKILHAFVHYNASVKLAILSFFVKLIGNHDRVALCKFSDAFPNIYATLMVSTESLLSSLQDYCDNGDVDVEALKKFNFEIAELLELSEDYLKRTNSDLLRSMCALVSCSRKNPKTYSNKLKSTCLKLAAKLDVPEECVSLQSLDASDVDLVSPHYEQKLMAALKMNPEKIMSHMKENFYFQQLLNEMLSILTALDDRQLDYYVVSCHLLKCDAILRVLQRIQIAYDLWTKQNKLKPNRVFNEAIPPKETRTILMTLKTVYKTHYRNMKTDTKCISTILDMITGMAVLLNTPHIVECCPLLQLLQLRNDRTLPSESSVLVKDVQMLVLKYLLVKNLFPVNLFKDPSKEYMSHLFNALSQDKTPNGLVHIMELSPLLIINEFTTENKLIGDYLLPAFLTKQVEIQKRLPRTVSALACMAFDDFVVSLNTPDNSSMAHIIFENKAIQVKLVCSKCHNEDRTNKTPYEFLTQYTERNIILYKSKQQKAQSSVSTGQRILFEKFLNVGNYGVLDNKDLFYLLKCFSNHTIFSEGTANSIITEKPIEVVAQIVRPFLTNVMLDDNTEESKKEAIMNVCINRLVHCTRNSLESNDYNQQKYTLDCIKEFGLSRNVKVLLPSTKLLVYYIMQPQCAFADKAVTYLKEVCDKHSYTTNQAYHRYKKDYCRLFVDCSVDSVQHFAPSILKVLRAFGFTGLVDFISKDVHHFLPYLIPFAVKVPHVPTMIEEIASLVQCSSSEFLSERFPHVYTHIYLYESDLVAKKSFDLIEKITGTKILNLIINHHRVILMDLLLQYCCNPEKVLKACRYLARHDPDTSGDTLDQSLSLSQIADFLHPRFLGVLAYFDNKLVNARVALSVKRKALQSFPDIMKLMGSKYLTPLRFKVLATLRSTLSLAKEFPKMLAQAWSAFIHNIDSVSLGPLLPNLAVSLLQQLPYAPAEINKIFQYLVLSNENLLSTHMSDLFFLEDTKVLERVKMVIRKHVKRTQPKEFLEKVTWYLRHLSQDIPDVKLYAFTCLDKLLKENRQEIHKAVFGRNNIDPVTVQLLECLKTGCGDVDGRVRLASGACLGQLGALETGLLPRQYVPPDRSPFAFSISDDCFASTALLELTRAFQYEKDTKIMDNYALTIQEILKVYGISPSGSKKEVWESFPEHMHQIMQPLLSSRYFLAFPAQPKKTHPLFGSAHAASFIEWAYNWAGQLIPLMESESVQELLRSVYPSMKRDVRTLLLFLPYMLLHAVMTPAHHEYIYEEMIHVVGTDSVNSQSRCSSERNIYRLLDSIGGTHEVTSNQTEDSNQVQLKCCKTVYMLLDFLNRWMLEWCHSKHHPTQNENYKSVKQFVEKWDKLSVSRGNLACGQLERALQQLELYMLECRERMQAQLPFLAGIYASLDEPDAVAGILTLKRSEPSLKELVLAHEVTGRVQDAAFCYERLAQDAQLDRHSLQGMVACYLSLDQPFTAYRLLSEREDEEDSLAGLAAEPLWRLGRWEQLEELLDKPASKCTDNWGLLFGRILVSYRGGSRENFDSSWRDGVSRLLTQLEDGAARGGAGAGGGGGLENMLNLHILTEARHAEETLHRLRALPDGAHECASLSRELLECWRLRACLVQSDVRTLEPLLRCRRILLQQTQKLLEPTHPRTASELRSHIGELWLQSAKHARKAGIFQQAYTYILNAEQYRPPRLFIEKARMYWARGQHEPAFTTLRRGLDEGPAHLDQLTVHQRQICAKARLLIATYNEQTTNVDVDVNLQHYKEAVEVYRQWEKSLVCLGAYYEKVSCAEESGGRSSSRRLHALNSYGRALQHGHKYLYQSMPRMLSIWLELDVSPEGGSLAELSEMTEVIRTYSERLPLYLFLTAFSQIVSRICHPVKEVYQQIKAIIVRLMVAYPQHTLWMLMCVMKSSYPQRHKRCQDVLADARLKEPHILKFIYDFTQLAEKLIDLCNKPITNNTLQRKSETQTASVRALVATLPRLLAAAGFSPIMMPFQQFCRIVLPSKVATQEERASFNVVSEPLVYISGIEDLITILPSLQHPRKVTLTGSDGKSYIIMLKPKDDLRKDFRLMEFNGVVNRLLQEGAETRRRRLYIRTYSVLPLNEECGLIEWVPNLLGLRPILLHLYKQKGILTNNRELKEMMCLSKDPLSRKLKVFQEQLLPRHPPVFAEWYRRVFADPYGWYQARSAYIRTTAVMSMVGYILGLGDRHGENILFDSTNGDAVHVDFNCLFNKGEGFEWPERVPFRLTHNMQTAMGPLRHEGMYRKCCEATMRELRAQTAALMSVIGPFVYDPLVTWSRARALADCASGERVNQQARQHLAHIRQRLNGMVRTKNKQLSVSLSPEGQVEHLIAEATSVENLCQMYLGWGPFL